MRTIAITRTRELTRRQRFMRWLRNTDPLLAVALALLVALVLWAAAPTAKAVSASSDTVINLSVPSSTSVVPAFTAGDTSVELPVQTVPGEVKTATSTGWLLGTNWANGYQVTLRSASDPALRGRNAEGSSAPRAYFNDFTVGGCPCRWNAEGDRGVFGYNVELSTESGAAADGSKWLSGSTRKWRGLTTSGYELFRTPGGTGQYGMTLRFQTEIPATGSQPAGAYRANLVAAVVPLL